MRGSGDNSWYTRKLEAAKAPGVTNRVLRRIPPEHLHGLLSVASEPSNRVPPLTDFRGETTEQK
jgi:hypothetical protein